MYIQKRCSTTKYEIFTKGLQGSKDTMFCSVGSCSFILVAIFISSSYGKIYEIKNSWDSGFQGELNIPIDEDTEYGWRLEIKFHKPIGRFECWTGELLKSEHGDSGSTFVYVNFAYNKVLKRGITLKVKFVGDFIGKTGPSVPPVTVKFQHTVIYSDHYDIPNYSSTISTTDIAYVINSLTKEHSSTRAPQSHFSSTKAPIPSVNDISGSQQGGYSDISGNTIEGNQDSNHIHNTELLDDSTSLDNDEDISDELGSGEEVIATVVPRRPSLRAKYPYIRLLHKSLLFYEAQRSGPLPPENRIPWRGDSAIEDKGHKGEDLSGGYYDAGDHMKFGFPMAFSITTIAWGVIEYWEAYQHAGELANVLDAIKWGVDYILKCYVGRYELYGQIGIGKKDHEYWGRPEDMFAKRPAFKITAKNPGSDLAAESSAALSAASLAFERSRIKPYASSGYVRKLKRTAESLYHFATTFKGKYHDAIKDAKNFYPSTNFLDEIVWAAAWLYRATGKVEYLNEAEGRYYNWGMFKLPEKFMFSWDDKTVGVQVLLSQVSKGAKKAAYVERASAYCREMRDNKSRYTPKGLLFMDEWSPLRYSANIAFICQMTANEGGDKQKNRAFARQQIHYMLGDTGRSYVVGFGKKYPKFPHHRASSCSNSGCGWDAYHSNRPNPNILDGALVGGPNKKDVFDDSRKNYKSSEVSLDHNSCFQSAVAGLLQNSIIGVPKNNRSHEPWFDNFIEITTQETVSVTSTSSANCLVRQSRYFWIIIVLFMLNWM